MNFRLLSRFTTVHTCDRDDKIVRIVLKPSCGILSRHGKVSYIRSFKNSSRYSPLGTPIYRNKYHVSLTSVEIIDGDPLTLFFIPHTLISTQTFYFKIGRQSSLLNLNVFRFSYL